MTGMDILACIGATLIIIATTVAAVCVGIALVMGVAWVLNKLISTTDTCSNVIQSMVTGTIWLVVAALVAVVCFGVYMVGCELAYDLGWIDSCPWCTPN